MASGHRLHTSRIAFSLRCYYFIVHTYSENIMQAMRYVPDRHDLRSRAVGHKVVCNGHQHRLQHVLGDQRVRRLRQERQDRGDVWACQLAALLIPPLNIYQNLINKRNGKMYLAVWVANSAEQKGRSSKPTTATSYHKENTGTRSNDASKEKGEKTKEHQARHCNCNT